MGKDKEGREAEMEEREIRTGRGGKEERRGRRGGKPPGTTSRCITFFTDYKRKFRVFSSLLVELRSHLW